MTIVINTMSEFPIQISISSEKQEWNFKFFWFDKDKGIGKWTNADDNRNIGNSGLFVIKEKMGQLENPVFRGKNCRNKTSFSTSFSNKNNLSSRQI